VHHCSGRGHLRLVPSPYGGRGRCHNEKYYGVIDPLRDLVLVLMRHSPSPPPPKGGRSRGESYYEHFHLGYNVFFLNNSH
jgi:hypothetical protein